MPNYIYRDAEEKYVKATVLYYATVESSTYMYHDSECTQMVGYEEAIDLVYNNPTVVFEPGKHNSSGLAPRNMPEQVTCPTTGAPIIATVNGMSIMSDQPAE